MAWYLAKRQSSIYYEEQVQQGKDGQPGIVQGYTDKLGKFCTRLLSADRLWECIGGPFDGATMFVAHDMAARYDKAHHWREVLRLQAETEKTHTSKLLRGAMRLAADLDVDPDTACMALGALVDADRKTADQMMQEGRY